MKISEKKKTIFAGRGGAGMQGEGSNDDKSKGVIISCDGNSRRCGKARVGSGRTITGSNGDSRWDRGAAGGKPPSAVGSGRTVWLPGNNG